MNNPVKLWRRQERERKNLNQEGVIISWTRISIAPIRFQKDVPYVVVLVELVDGRRVYGQVASEHHQSVFIGMKVRSTLRRVGESDEKSVISYGIKFVPIS